MRELYAYVAEMARLTRDLSQVDTVRAARAAVDRHLATLERDAARDAIRREEDLRMVNQLDAVVDVLGIAESDVEPADEIRALIAQNAQSERDAARMREAIVETDGAIRVAMDAVHDDTLRVLRLARNTLQAAIAPSGEPTTTPETSE